ncbi:MAG TPA: TetR/AcrR family transcriptional regulator [bacterium]|nr:TetR/AcrR family transcriptional regulator [bacterium]
MNAGPVELQWVRTPHQDRSRKTLERLLDTSEALLQERGFDNVSVAEIAHAAGSSVGAFYARFRDKNGLLHHLHERFCEEAMVTADTALDPARWEGASTRDILTAVIGFLEESHRTRSGMFRAFVLVGHSDPRFQERDRRLSEHVLARLTALLLSRREEISHPDPTFAIAFGMEMVGGVLRDRYVLGWHRLRAAPKGAGGIVAELVRAYCSYLGVPLCGTAPAAQPPSAGGD